MNQREPGLIFLKPSKLDWRYWLAKIRFIRALKKQEDTIRKFISETEKRLHEIAGIK